MTDQEIRAKALECASQVCVFEEGTDEGGAKRAVLGMAEVFQVYIRLGMEGAEGMLK